jgi:hypothetical protein
MSIAAFAIGEASLGALPSQKIKSSKTPDRRQYVVKSDATALPEAR